MAPDAAESARARFLELAPGGFEEVETRSALELAAYADAAGAERFFAAFPQAVATPVVDGWETSWRAFHRPVTVSGVWIGPPWEAAPAAVPAVHIDPGRAFGTGAHPTTRLCLTLLAAVEPGSLVDVGCGSGVLGLSASRLGFSPLYAVDVDPVAVETARANAAVNGVELEVELVDATVGSIPAADVAVANIALAAVEAVLPRLSARDALTSGYLAVERPKALGWVQVRTLRLDGWAADHFRRE